MKVKLLSEFATVPKKGTKSSAGFDLYSAYNYAIEPNDNCLVFTDITIKMPKGVYGRIAPRSGLALRFNLQVGGGVIGNKLILYFILKHVFQILTSLEMWA